MQFKTWIIIGAVIICLIVFVFGKETVSYLSGARQYTNADSRVYRTPIPLISDTLGEYPEVPE